MMKIALRPYQQEAVDSVIAEHAKGVSRQLISLPTAAGKTVIMASIIKTLDNKKVLILAHTDELIEQSKRTIAQFISGSWIGICKGPENQLGRQIVIGSVQTCRVPKRLAQLKREGFDVLMIDEAHHAPAKSYQAIIEALGFKDSPNKLLIGVTATPQRSDALRLNDTFEKVVYSRSIAYLIQEKWLSPVIGRKILTGLTIKNISTYMGDYAIGQLANEVNVPKRNELVVQKHLQYAAGRKAVAFCVDVDHAKALAAKFNDKGIAAAAVWGSMPMDERKKALCDLKAGRIQVVTSCSLLTEGFDEPSISAIIMARPTKSNGLYIQCVGRGLRLSPGKENCFVLDFTDSGHTLHSSMTLGTAIPELKHAEQPEESHRERERVRTLNADARVISDTELDLFTKNRSFFWVALDHGECSLTDDDGNEFVLSPVAGGFVATLCHNGKVVNIIEKPTSLNYCICVCEDIAKSSLNMTYAARSGGWLSSASKTESTSRQRQTLAYLGIDAQNMTKAEAFRFIRQTIALQKQRRRHMSPLQHVYHRDYNNNGQFQTGLN